MKKSSVPRQTLANSNKFQLSKSEFRVDVCREFPLQKRECEALSCRQFSSKQITNSIENPSLVYHIFVHQLFQQMNSPCWRMNGQNYVHNHKYKQLKYTNTNVHIKTIEFRDGWQHERHFIAREMLNNLFFEFS